MILTFILLLWGRPGMNLSHLTTDLTLLAATLYFSIMLNLLNLYFNSSFLSTVSLFFRDPNFQVNIDFLFPFPLIFSLSANCIIHLKLFLDPSFPSHFQGQFSSLKSGLLWWCSLLFAPQECLLDFCHKGSPHTSSALLIFRYFLNQPIFS